MNDYLDSAELFALTGRKQAAKQREWLKRHQWRFTATADGIPRVLRAYRDKRLAGSDEPVIEQPEPDWRDVA